MQHHGDGLSITRRLFAHKLSLFFYDRARNISYISKAFSATALR